jgi:hypothetical protein
MNGWGNSFSRISFVETCVNNCTYVAFPCFENRKMLPNQRFCIATASCDATSPSTIHPSYGEIVIKVFDGDEIKGGVLVIYEYINPALLCKRRLWVPAVGEAT